MEAWKQNPLPYQGAFTRTVAYRPARTPGFVAWATAFSYGDGSMGVCFDEVTQEDDPDYRPPRLEYAEAAGVPVSYAAVEAGSPARRSWRVYLRTADGVHFEQTGRCPRAMGALCHAGFPDGRIVGYDVPRRNEAGTGWSHFISVRQSTDGGASFREVGRLLEGCAPYLWRVRRLPDGQVILLASLYGTPWGPGLPRPTRNTQLPRETYTGKIQTFFMVSRDGVHFDGPHYILPGIGAHEYDVAPLPDGRLLFVAGDVQGTPVGRQVVRPTADGQGWVNEPMLPIEAGGPPCPAADPQGGFVPETVVWDARQGCLVGYRRNRCLALSNDEGAHWVPVAPPPGVEKLYQPVLSVLADGALMLVGHVGGDTAFGQGEPTIVSWRMEPACAGALPAAAQLSLARLMTEDKAGYRNAFQAQLTSGGRPLAGREVEFRFAPYWKADGAVNTAPQADAPFRVRAVTGPDGAARADAPWFDGVGDIHLAYNADVVFPGAPDARACAGPLMTVLALTPRRRCLYPYDAYFAGGVLYLSPGFLADFPGALETLRAAAGQSGPPAQLPAGALARLAGCGVVRKEKGAWQWIASVHAPRLLDDVQPMAGGDWYV